MDASRSVGRGFVAMMLLLTLVLGLTAARGAGAQDLGIDLPTVTPPIDLPDEVPTVAVPTVAVPTVVVPTVEVPDVDVPDVDVPVVEEPLPSDTAPGEIVDESQNIDAQATVAITINVLNCGAEVSFDADAVVLASLDATALIDLGCQPASDVAFRVTGEGNAEVGSGVSADGVVTIDGLTQGETVTVVETVPDGFVALTESQVTVAEPGSQLLFVNVDADAEVTADLAITKITCGAEIALDADAVVLGQLDATALVDLGCELADGVAFTVTGEGNAEHGSGVTADGALTIDDLQVGAEVLVSETVPDGYQAIAAVQATIVRPGASLLFVNVATDADVTSDLTIRAFNCGADVTLDADAVIAGSAGLRTLLDLGCTPADGVGFTVIGEGGATVADGVTADGRLIIEDLDFGTTVSVTEDVPEGFTAIADTQATVVTPEAGLIFVNVAADTTVTADLTIRKLACAADVEFDVDAVLSGAVDADALVDLGCEFVDDVAFTVNGDANAQLGNGVTVDGELLIEDLAVGTQVTVTETVPEGFVALTESQVAIVAPGLELLFVNVAADADLAADLAITKLTCAVDVELDVEAIVARSVDAAALIDLGCTLTDDVAFTVTGDGGAQLGSGLTVDGRLTIEDITVGATISVAETVPAGYTALTEVQTAVMTPGLGLLFVNIEPVDGDTGTTTPDDDAGIDAAADLTVRVLICGAEVTLDADAVIAGEITAQALLDLGCTPADGVSVNVTGALGDAVGGGVTADGQLLVEDIATGTVVTVTQTAPDGTIPVIGTQELVVTGDAEVTLVNVDADATVSADLSITKLNCGANLEIDVEAVIARSVDAEALLTLGCTFGNDVAFTVSADAEGQLGEGVTADGSLVIDDLLVGTTVTVVETVPDGFTALTESQVAVVVPGLDLLFVNIGPVDGGGDGITTPDPDGTSTQTPVVDIDAEATVDLTITKLNCAAELDIDIDTVTTGSTDASALLELGCTPGDNVAFTVAGEGGAALGRGVTVDGQLVIESLPIEATVTVTEQVPDGYTALTESQTTVLTAGISLLFVNIEIGPPGGGGDTPTPTPDGGDDGDATSTPTPDGGDSDPDSTPTSTPDPGSVGDPIGSTPTPTPTPDNQGDDDGGDDESTDDEATEDDEAAAGVGGAAEDERPEITTLPNTGDGATAAPLGSWNLVLLLALGTMALTLTGLAVRRHGGRTGAQ